MEKNELVKIIRGNLEEGKLHCGRAHAIAREYNVRLWEIGEACDEENIKIAGCQLGCF
jgi:hypothetical protein